MKEKAANGIQGIKANEKRNTNINNDWYTSFTVFLANAKQLNVRAYTLSGQLVHTNIAQGNETNIDASAWEKVYILFK